VSSDQPPISLPSLPKSPPDLAAAGICLAMSSPLRSALSAGLHHHELEAGDAVVAISRGQRPVLGVMPAYHPFQSGVTLPWIAPQRERCTTLDE